MSGGYSFISCGYGYSNPRNLRKKIQITAKSAVSVMSSLTAAQRKAYYDRTVKRFGNGIYISDTKHYVGFHITGRIVRNTENFFNISFRFF